MGGDVVLVLAKRPEVGRAKTRLARDLGPERAQRLAEAFTFDSLRAAAAVEGARCHIAYAPSGAAGWFRHHAPRAVLHRQLEVDLGGRMRAAFEAAFAAGAGRVIAIGTDAPHLTPGRLRAALDCLSENPREGCGELCIGPSEDGGYYLIGMRRLRPSLFDGVAWGTSEVMATTRARIAALGLRHVELPTDVDVDDARSLARLRERLREDPSAAPVTRRCLMAWGSR